MFQILHIEDSVSDAFLVREAVRQSSIQATFTTATDGEQALRILSSPGFTPNLIILDLNLPKLSGLDVLERYRRDNDGVPVIVFTSSSDPQERERAFALGVREYLTKPIDLDAYLNKIRAAIERWAGPTASSGGLARRENLTQTKAKRDLRPPTL